MGLGGSFTIAAGATIDLSLGYTESEYHYGTENGVTVFDASWHLAYGSADSSEVSASPASGSYVRQSLSGPIVKISVAAGPSDVGKTFSITGFEYEATPDGITGQTDFTYNYTIVSGASASPNLVFTACTVTPSTALAGSTVKLSYTLKNEGTGSAAASDVEIYLSTSPTFDKSTATPEGQFSMAALGAGDAVVENISDTLDLSPGQYYFFAYEEQNGAVSAAAPFTVKASSPDLVFTSFSLSPGSEVAQGSITLKYVLTNKGTATAAASNVQVYYSSSPEFDQATASPVTQSFNALAPNDSFAGTEVINPVPLPPGQYYFFMYVDDNGDIAYSSPEALTITAPPLFTTGANVVNFNRLTAGQQIAIQNGANKYNGLGGNDIVTLPSEANETESVGNGQQLNWHDTQASLFHTDSLAGQTYKVSGSDGDYYIDCGAGTDIITIVNPDPTQQTSFNTIIAGSGKDTITITDCNGDNTITAGTGSPTININGYGNNKLQLQGADPPTIYGNIVTTANPNIANNGSLTFDFLLDATDTFSGTLSGDGEFDVEFGTLVMHGGDAFTGPVGILNATLELTSAAAVGSGPISFLPPNGGQLAGTLQVDGTTMPSNVISGFIPNVNTTIDLRGVPYSDAGTATLLPGNVLEVIQDTNNPNSVVYHLNLDPSYDYSTYYFVLSSDDHGGTKIGFGDGVAAGQTQDYPTLDDGADLPDSGLTIGCDCSAGGTEDVESGGTAKATVVHDGGNVTVSTGGHASGTLIDTGGITTILSGGSAVSTTISSGGTEIVSAGGTATGTTVSSGGTEIVSGTAVKTVVASGGTELVYGSAVSATVQSGGRLCVESGGVASGTRVSAGGTEYVLSGGLDSGTVLAGGAEVVSSGGTASATVVSTGGNETVYGSGAGATLLAGGQLHVASGGVASGTQVSAGGTEIISAGGTDRGTTVFKGGVETVLSGSIAGNTTVSGALTLTGGSIGAGATLETASGGTALLGGAIGNSGTLFASGAASLLEIVNGASVTGGGIAEVGNGTLFLQAAGDTEMVDFLGTGTGGLELSDTAANTTAFGGMVSGLGGNTHQYIDLVSVTSNTSVHLSYASASNTSGTLTVTSGGQTVASIALLGNYTSANFKLGADTGHHVEIIDPPVSVSSAVHSANIALFGGYIANFAAGGGFGGVAVIELPPPGSQPLLTQPHA